MVNCNKIETSPKKNLAYASWLRKEKGVSKATDLRSTEQYADDLYIISQALMIHLVKSKFTE